MAATEAFEAELDQVVALGWAHIERVAFEGFIKEAAAAPKPMQAALKVLLTHCFQLEGLPGCYRFLVLEAILTLITPGVVSESSSCFCAGASSSVRFDQGGAQPVLLPGSRHSAG